MENSKVFIIDKDLLDIYSKSCKEEDLIGYVYNAIKLKFRCYTIQEMKKDVKIGDVILFRIGEKMEMYDVVNKEGDKVYLEAHYYVFPSNEKEYKQNMIDNMKKFYPSVGNVTFKYGNNFA